MKKTVIRLLNKLRLLRTFNFVFTTVVNRQRFKVPLIKGLGFGNIDISEPWMIQLLETVLIDRKDKAFIDVGVNIGQTLIKLKSVSPEIKYYGFEPNPTCIYYVRELIKVNGFENVILFPVGISDKTSLYELSFFSNDDADSAASILNNFRPFQRTYRKEYIACFNISEIVAKYEMLSIGILKIDVEGAEKEVIEGFREKIVIDQPIIQLEMLPVYSDQNKERLIRQEALENFFRQINYTILRIHTNDSNELTGLEEIREIGIHSNPNWCEYLIVPSDIKGAIIKKTPQNA